MGATSAQRCSPIVFWNPTPWPDFLARIPGPTPWRYTGIAEPTRNTVGSSSGMTLEKGSPSPKTSNAKQETPQPGGAGSHVEPLYIPSIFEMRRR